VCSTLTTVAVVDMGSARKVEVREPLGFATVLEASGWEVKGGGSGPLFFFAFSLFAADRVCSSLASCSRTICS
jgi:hypothetical protein